MTHFWYLFIIRVYKSRIASYTQRKKNIKSGLLIKANSFNFQWVGTFFDTCSNLGQLFLCKFKSTNIPRWRLLGKVVQNRNSRKLRRKSVLYMYIIIIILGYVLELWTDYSKDTQLIEIVYLIYIILIKM